MVKEPKIIHAPFRISDNIYFVGNYDTSSHLIVTEKGLILLDTVFPEHLDDTLNAMKELGYQPSDLCMILISHAHSDHFGSVNELRKLCKAPVYISEIDAPYTEHLKEGSRHMEMKADRTFRDGDILKVGSTEITCISTPGHTVGTFSFFFNTTLNGKPYRAGMFGGIGNNTINAGFFNRTATSYFTRRIFLESIEKLRGQQVDIVLGNHCWNNSTYEKSLRVADGESDAFLDPTEWNRLLDKLIARQQKKAEKDAREFFLNFAHRGASELCPENTLLSFATGVFLGANAVETDVRMTKDGVLVLHHDKTPVRLGGVDTPIAEMTYEELSGVRITANGYTDKIPTVEEFLQLMAHRDLFFAIEIKQDGVAEKLLSLLKKYGLEKKSRITAFKLPYLQQIHALEPAWPLGYLTDDLSDETLRTLTENGIDEICPEASVLDEAQLRRLRDAGFHVRAWGVKDRDTMKRLYDLGVDGMTVNFPDALEAYRKECAEAEAI